MSGILLHTMEVHNGNNLVETLTDLNIETGQLSENAISAWFDTDSENDSYLLNWLCNLNKSNILLPFEKQEYQEILKSNSFIGFEDCEKEIDDILLQYPTLLNTDENVLDIQLLESEIETLLEKEAKQELLLSKTKELYEKLMTDLTQVTVEKSDSFVLKTKELEHCTELCAELDNLNKQLHFLLTKLHASICNFQNASISLYFSNIDVATYFDFSEIVTSSVDIYLKENNEDTTGFTSFLNLDNETDDDEYLTTMKERIYRSTLDYLHKQIDEKCRIAELEFLENYTSSVNLNTSTNLENNADVLIKAKNKLDLMNHQLENYVEKLSSKHIYAPQTNLIKDKVSENQRKLNKTLALKEALIKIMRYQNILLLMYKTEQETMLNADTIFKNVLNYIIEELKKCETRTDTMLETAKNFKKSTDVKNKIIQCITKLLCSETETCTSLTNGLKVMSAFKTEKNLLLKQLHTDDFDRFIHSIKERNRNNSIMIKYLQSGPISRITVIPHPLLHLIMEIDDLLIVQKNKIMDTINIQKHAQTKLEKNKWLRHRRQLWMYFLKDPKKMLMYIDEIHLNLKQLYKIE